MESAYIPAGPTTGLSDEHLFRLGEMAVYAAQLEFEIARNTSELVSVDQSVGDAVIAGLPFSRMLALARSIVEAKLPDNSRARGAFAASVGLAVDAMNGRNRLLHGNWVAMGLPNEPILMRRGKPKTQIEYNVTFDQIERATAKLVEAAEAVASAYFAAFMELERTSVGGLSVVPGHGFQVE